MLSLHVKLVQTDRRPDEWMDNNKTICPGSFDTGGHKNRKNQISEFYDVQFTVMLEIKLYHRLDLLSHNDDF